MFLSDGTVISISLRVEFTVSLTTIPELFTVIVLSVLTGMSHMMAMLFPYCASTVSLWLMLLPFVCNLHIMIFTDAPMEICCSIIVAGDVLCLS